MALAMPCCVAREAIAKLATDQFVHWDPKAVANAAPEWFCLWKICDRAHRPTRWSDRHLAVSIVTGAHRARCVTVSQQLILVHVEPPAFELDGGVHGRRMDWSGVSLNDRLGRSLSHLDLACRGMFLCDKLRTTRAGVVSWS